MERRSTGSGRDMDGALKIIKTSTTCWGGKSHRLSLCILPKIRWRLGIKGGWLIGVDEGLVPQASSSLKVLGCHGCQAARLLGCCWFRLIYRVVLPSSYAPPTCRYCTCTLHKVHNIHSFCPSAPHLITIRGWDPDGRRAVRGAIPCPQRSPRHQSGLSYLLTSLPLSLHSIGFAWVRLERSRAQRSSIIGIDDVVSLVDSSSALLIWVILKLTWWSTTLQRYKFTNCPNPEPLHCPLLLSFSTICAQRHQTAFKHHLVHFHGSRFRICKKHLPTTRFQVLPKPHVLSPKLWKTEYKSHHKPNFFHLRDFGPLLRH